MLGIFSKIISLLILPVAAAFFFDKKVGENYGLSFIKKIKLLLRFRRNTKRVESASSWLEHLTIASEILKLPPELEGNVIECGCFKGASTANLSIACSIAGRKLIVCDSFAGLPAFEQSDNELARRFPGRTAAYQKGEYSGQLEHVKSNVNKYGCIESCEFIQGYFKDTLGQLEEDIALAFLDVDLYSSLEDCLKHVWPLLREGCFLFSHEARYLPFISLFFDREWWAEHFYSEPPLFVGAGTGLPITPGFGSALGYTIKGHYDNKLFK